MNHTYQVVELGFNEFYDRQAPEGRVFTFTKRTTDEPLPTTWKIPHWALLEKLLTGKGQISENGGKNCGLIEAARDYYHNHPNDLSLMASSFDLSLPELSIIVKQREENRIFIPNLSITQAKKGVYVPYQTIDSFLASDSFILIRNIVQYSASNPDPTIPQTDQNALYCAWARENGAKAIELLRDSLEFHPGQMFVEGQSPDLVLAELGHHAYEDIADKVAMKKSLPEMVRGDPIS